MKVLTIAALDQTAVQALLVGLACFGVISVYRRLEPRISSRSARGAMVLALALATVTGLAIAEGLQELVAVLAFWALCVLGVVEFRDWTRAGLSVHRDRAGTSGPPSREHAREDPEVAFRRDDARGHPGAAFNLGQLLAKRGKLEEAQDAYRRADERGHREAGCSLGGLLRSEGDVEGAKGAYSRAEQRGHREAAHQVGLLRQDRGEKAGHAAAAFSLAALLKRRGDEAGAQDAQRRGQGLRRRRKRSPTSFGGPARPASVVTSRTPRQPPQRTRAKAICPFEGKTVQSREEALKVIEASRGRYARGEVDKPLDHEYYCERGGH